MAKTLDDKIKVGVTIGDYNGVGIEVIIKTFMDARMLSLCTPIVYGSSKVVGYHRKALGINDFSFNQIKDATEANTKKANLVNCWEELTEVKLGEPTEMAGKYAVLSLECAVKDLAAGKIDVLVTAPINKKTIQSKDFNFPGHTEYLQAYSNAESSLMLMVAGDLRVGVATGHLPLKEVSENLTKELIIEKLQLMQASMVRDFGLQRPKIAVLGLNPHAGDNGLLGAEEQDVIIPAIKKMREEGMLVYGPFASDGFFGSSALSQYDCVLAMYHDQGLAPFKALSFENGVNYTAGLPIVRTSPDHGTGYDIAGKNVASEQSLRQAIFLAMDIYRKRMTYKEINSNPLPLGKTTKKDRG
ncbi:MAG: 4-hydroxythreonine-4-phosphate dehydrogenase [Flavobacteriales bacterium]|jgi:4-hydroxythreonine-4-phosphate dehydrogenase